MMSSEEKYQNDEAYRPFVDSVEKLLHEHNFSVSEIFEMVGFARVHFVVGRDFKWTPEEILNRET